METLAPSVSTRDPKGLKFVSVVEAAYNKAALTDGEAQRVNDTAGLSDLIAKFIADNRRANQFASEEVSSNYAYPKEYKGPRPIEEQIKAIAKIFNLDPASALEYAKGLPTLPEGAEGWFAIPKIEAIAGNAFPGKPAEQYCHAIELLMEKVGKARKFRNWREGELTVNHIRQHVRTLEALGQLAEVQKGDILIVAAQFGMRHRGRSTRRAREVFVAGEFGLGAFAVGCMALTHPERYVRFDELDTDCPGDEYAPDADGVFSKAPYCYFDDDRFHFDTDGVVYAGDGFGSVSGFSPQQ